MNRIRISVWTFIKKKWHQFRPTMESFTLKLVSIASTQDFADNKLSYLTIFLTGATESGVPLAKSNFENIFPIKVPKRYTGEIHVFWGNSFFKFVRILLPGTWPSFFNTDFFDAMKALIQKRQNQKESCITVKATLQTQAVEVYVAIEKSGPAFFITNFGHKFESNVGKWTGVMSKAKRDHNWEEREDVYDIVRRQSQDKHRPDRLKIGLWHKRSIAAFFHFLY